VIDLLGVGNSCDLKIIALLRYKL